jgi:ubiquitin-protein ligase
MTSAVRLAADLEALRALENASRGTIRFERLPSAARPELQVVFACTTAGNTRYPAERATRVTVHVALPERYPFQPPVATVRTPIVHPNVYASGVICLGTRWLPAEGLDLFVQRLLRLVTFDPLLINATAPANREAAAWYWRTREQHPEAFPTDRVALEQLSDRVVRECPACARSLRLPRGRSGRVRCPGCGKDFEART